MLEIIKSYELGCKLFEMNKMLFEKRKETEKRTEAKTEVDVCDSGLLVELWIINWQVNLLFVVENGYQLSSGQVWFLMLKN